MRPNLLQVVDSQSKHNQIRHHSFVRVHFETKAIIKEHGDNMAASFFVSQSATSEASITYQQGSLSVLFSPALSNCISSPPPALSNVYRFSPRGLQRISRNMGTCYLLFDVSQRIEI